MCWVGHVTRTTEAQVHSATMNTVGAAVAIANAYTIYMYIYIYIYIYSN